MNILGLGLIFFVSVSGIYAMNPIKSSEASKLEISLAGGWQFRQVGKDDWHPATIPGCVHTDLLSNKLIEDPFYRDNEKKQQWIGKTDWEYQTTFQVAAEMLKRENIELVFEGLDTYANVFLNDQPILDADNMFRRWRVNVKNKLKPGDNVLRIKFRSPINEILPVMAKMNYELPAVNDQGEKTSPYTRKAPYQYGWDWGPRFVTSGVWKPVYLNAWDKARIEDLNIRQKELKGETASLTAEVEVIASGNADATVEIENLNDKKVVVKQSVKLTVGTNTVALDFVVANPKLWYPVGYGEQPLYNFRAKLISNNKTVDQTVKRIGLRSVELRQQPDQYGKSFEFVVNGIPVFAKGGNWVPADSFPTRITREKYRNLLESARDANMNTVRVWGGGIYESDDFYDAADEMGLLVWQDFMFACSMYPGDQAFLDNVRQEAVDNVKRLRNHPSIVIWVGNNEIETAWAHWGWKDKLPAKLWEDYKKIFLGVLPEVVSKYDSGRAYWSSSPSSNFEDDADSQKIGDVHYWQVWHASAPFTEYEKQFPRFMSEYGFQSFPEIETVKTYTLPEDRAGIETPIMLTHQRHPRGNQLIREYMLREFKEPKDFESFLYVSQVLQAEGIKIGAEHFRRIMPQNMGSLYWQINDCWPVASWSGMDYLGRWKALHYYARRFYNDLLISPHVADGNLHFIVVSDRTKPTPAQLIISLMDLQGKLLMKNQTDVNIAPLKSASYSNSPIAELIKGFDTKNLVLIAELKVDGKTVSQNEYFFKPFKELSISPAHINTQIAQTKMGYKLILTTDNFAKAVYLSTPGSEGFFTDNYFNLIAGKPVEVEFRTRQKMTAEELRGKLIVKSLSDAF
ncbi:MAG: glycoside hydrolase family 2 protein [Pyrinomonadaceae bacterium]